MVRALADQGFTGGAADLRRGQLAQFWMAGPNWLEALTRCLVEGYARSGGRLGDGVLELAAGRHFNIQPYRRPLPPYSEAEWHRLTTACRQQVDDVLRRASARAGVRRRRAASAARVRGLTRTSAGCCRRSARSAAATLAEQLACLINVFRHRGVTAVFHEAALAMFPHLDVVIAYRLLFGIYSGIVPDGIADLETGDIDWAGDSTILLSYVKRPHRRREPDPAAAGGAVARAVAGALGAAAQLRAAARADHAVVGDEPARLLPPTRRR